MLKEHGIDFTKEPTGAESPYSRDAILLHISYEGLILEDPSKEPDEAMWLLDKFPRGGTRYPRVY